MPTEGQTRSGASKAGRSRQAQRIKDWRNNPANKKREKLIIKIHEEVVREMIAHHKDEYITRINEKRLKHGLNPYRYRARKHKPGKTTIQQPTAAQQQACPHDQGVNKFTYGIFCKECGKRIR